MDNANDLKEALDFISPANLTYEEWVTVGMGLKEAGFPVTAWEQWSSRDGSRYHKGECARKWESFRGNPKPITENSIFALARNHGWPGPAGHELDWNDAICAPGTRPDGVVVDTRWLDVQELNIPEQWDPADQLRRYLQALFEPEEHVAYVTESYLRDDRYAPTKGCWDRTAGQLMDELTRCGGDIGAVVGDYNPAAGAWICFNPVEGGRSNNNVTDYRYALVECDNMELEKQQAISHSLLKNLRYFRHNMINMLYGLEGVILKGDTTELRAYYQDMAHRCALVNNENILALERVNDPAVSAVLLRAVDRAREKEMPFFLYVQQGIGAARGLKSSDTCQILGVLLDNALEAADQSAEPSVRVEMRTVDGMLEILVCNTYAGRVDPALLSQGGHSTKEGHMGQGLASCYDILSRKKGAFLNFDVSGQYVRAQLLIRMKYKETDR